MFYFGDWVFRAKNKKMLIQMKRRNFRKYKKKHFSPIFIFAVVEKVIFFDIKA
jgi:hypothetical protein